MRFRDEGERAKHREGISRRKHARLINENFSAASLYCTLTLDDAHEVTPFRKRKKIRDRYIRRLKYDYPDAVIFALSRPRKKHASYSYAYACGWRPAGSHSKKNGDKAVSLRVDRLRGTQLLQRDRPRAGLHGACQLSLRPLDARTGRTSMEANQKMHDVPTSKTPSRYGAHTAKAVLRLRRRVISLWKHAAMHSVTYIIST